MSEYLFENWLVLIVLLSYNYNLILVTIVCYSKHKELKFALDYFQ